MKRRSGLILNLVVLMSILLSAVATPASASVPAPKAAIPAQTTVSGPIVSPPVLPADTTGMSPVSASNNVPSDKAQGVKGGLLLPRANANSTSTGDKVLQTEQANSSMPAPIYNWEGVNNLDGVYPPDTDGEAGKDHYIQMVNLHTAIYDKAGNLLYGPFTPNLLWPAGDPCRLQNDGDVVTLYDQFADRWLMTQFALPNYPSGPFYECFAVSKTGAPTNVPSDWWLYTFLVHSTKMDDYPKVSVWPDAYYMTVNQFNPSWAGAGVFAFDKAKMLAGQATTFQYFDLYTANVNFGGMLPGDLDGSTLPPAGAPGLFFEVDDSSWIGPEDAMRIWKFHVDWTTPSNSTFGVSSQPNFTLPVENFDLLPCTVSGSRNCIPQPGTSQKLDAIGDRLMFRAVYRNFGDHDAVLINHTVKADGTDRAGIRWYEVRDLFGTPSIYQQGTFAPADGGYRWMGSLAFDHVGNIALGYSISSSTIFPSIRYAGRLVGDPLGTLPQDEVSVIAGSGSQTGTGARWGDYSAMSIDPVDDCTFYYTQEYIQTTGSANWQTRVAAFKFPSCSIGPQGVLRGRVVKQSNPTQGIAGASIVATASPTQTVNTTTGADGSFSTPLLVGTYDVTASAYAYLPATITGVSVTEGMTTTMSDIPLTAAASYTVDGVVKDARTGWPLYAKIVVEGAPIDPIWTNPVTGAYSVDLLAGTQFTFKATDFWGSYAESNVVVGPLTGNLTQDIFLEPDLQACTAPGYKQNIYGNQQGFDSTSLPAGWTVQHVSGACDWTFNNPGGRANLTGGSGNFAIADSDICGSGTTMNTILYSPKVDVSALSQIMLSFKYDYRNLSSSEVAKTEVSADGGSTWNTVVSWNTDQRGPATFTQDVTSLLAGATQAQVRFTYVAPGWDWWWELDDFFLGMKDCVPQAGGLVVGSVKDVNTDLPLLGATVQDDGLASTQTVITPLDPNVPDAFYTLFAPSGSRTITASMPQYASSVANVTVPLSGTVGQDFALGAGLLSYTPTSMDVTVAGGVTTTLPLTITNSGSVTATYTINEIDTGFLPFGPFEKPPFVVKPFRQQAPTSQGGGVSNPPAGPAWEGDELLATLPLSNPATPWGIAFNSQTGKLWIGDSWTPSATTIQEFNTDGIFTRKEWPYSFSSEYGPADAAYNPHTGTLWVMGVRADHENCIYEINPQSGPTGRKICPGFSTTQRGLAYDPTTDTYFAGSWTDQSIHRFTSDGKLLSSKYVGLNISGLAYNASSQHLFVATNASATRFYVLDVADDYARLGEFQVSGFSSYGGAGLEMDCSGNLWAVDQLGKQIYKLASGEITTMCLPSDLTWVSETIATGSVGPGKSTVVDVTFNGSVAPGIYTGQLQFLNDTPYAVPNMPLKLTVQVSPASGKVTGTVSTPGACDINPAVLANEPVTIKSFDNTIWNLTTNSQGMYSQWIDQVHSPVTVTVNIAGYQPGIYTNVAVIGGGSVTKDFTLRTLQPCFSVAPPTLAVTLTLGQNTSRPVKVNNSGAASGTFTTTESSLGFIPGMPDTSPTGVQTDLFSLAGPAVEKVAGPYTPGDVNLVIDDGTAENSIGLTLGGAFIWLNRFTPAPSSYPFTLDSVSLIFPTTTPNGSAMQLVVYEDADGNPANGATFKYAQNVTVLNNDGATWNVYNLTTPVQLNGPTGDVLIGVVNRGATAVGQFPASIDQNSTLQRRSWIGLYTGTVPDPPTLPADSQFGIIDDLGGSALAGNWTLRGTGSTGSGVPVNLDWLTEAPTQSIVTADSFEWVTVGFDAAKVALPGQYKAAVNFNTNDSLHKILPVNVTMNVVATALWGQLQGNVEATDRCDVGQNPMAEATVTATGTDAIVHTLTTDASGHYLVWLPSSASPFTIVATKPGYYPASAGGIIVNNGGAMTNAPTLVLRKNTPCVGYNPTGLSITLPWGGTGNQTLNLTNSGPASSQFTITEQAGGFTPLAPSLILNESFDGSTFPPVGWTRYDKDSTTTAQWERSTSAPHSGSGEAFHNYGLGAPAEDGWLVTPPVELGINSTLTFWEKASFAAWYVKHSVWVCTSSCANPPANYVQVVETGALPSSGTWRMQTIDLNTYNNQTLMIAFRYQGYDADGWYIDDVQVTSAADIVKWLSETPETGTIPANTGNFPVTVGFNAGDASITQPGTYTAFLKVANQDAGNTPLTVPVTMTVQPAAAQGKLTGIVSGLLYCDGSPGVPLNNASVQIRGGVGISMTLKTDTAGFYQRWLGTGVYTVTVSAANYLSQAVTNVSVTDLMTTTLDFDLRWLKPCVNAAPTSLAATVNLGANATLPFTLANLGPVATPFKITKLEGGFNPYEALTGADVLVVNEITADATAMEAALTALGYSYDEVTNTVYTGMTVNALLTYKAVLYAGIISSGAEQTQTMAYLDAGGNLLLASNDEGYSYSSSVFYATYLEAHYGTDAGSKGTITGQDIMAGINMDISSDPYPDNFTIIGSHAVGIFHNDAPNTDWAGLRIARNDYRAVYLAWNFQYTGGTSDTATKLAVMSRAMNWLAPFIDVPWLSASPITGTLAADTGQQVVNVTMDAAQVNQPGVYYAGLKARTSDPVNPFRTIAVTMTVPVNPDMGKLNGIVYGLGACDINPAPLANASVSLTDGVFNWTTSTDATGYYQFWVSATNPLTVTASAADHLPDQAVVSVPGTVTVTHDLHLRWLKPCIDATPDSLTADLTYGMTTTKVLSLTNSGLAIGNFTITPHTQGFIPTLPVPGSLVRSAAPSTENAKTAPVQAGMTAPIFVATGIDLITEGFEGATFPPTGWTQVVNDAAFTWQVGTNSPHSGAKYADIAYDSTLAQQDEWLLSPELNLTSATLSLWSFGSVYWCKDTYDNCDVNVWLVVGSVGGGDDILVGTADDAWTATWTWAQSTWNLDSLLTGGPVRIGIQYYGLDGAEAAVDDIVLTGTTGGGGGAANYPWLTTIPVSGTVPVGGGTAVDVIFDSTKVPQPGTYTGYLLVETDTPVYTSITVPVTMTATVPVGWSKLMGTVRDLGYCDASPAPLQDATVFIEGTGGFTATVKTAADGTYQFWMLTSSAPLTVTASKEAGFVAKTVTDVLLGAVPTTQNFDLRENEPCVSTNPQSYNVTIVRGGTLTTPLTLNNDGALGTDFEFSEVDGGFIPTLPVPGSLVRSAAPSAENAKTAPAQAGMTAPIFVATGTDLITEGFEGATFPPAGWTQVVNDAGYTWQVGTASPHSGTKYADIVYDSTLAQQDEWLLSPELNLTSATLSLWSFGSVYWCKDTYDNCDVNVWLVVGSVGGGDDILVGTADDAWTASWTWAQSTWNLDSLLTGGPVRIGIQYYGLDGAEAAVDDIVLNGTTGGGGGAVAWLNEIPITGTLASDSSQNGNILFDTTMLTETGQYKATLNLDTADPEHPELPIPVTMTVILPTYAVSLSSDPLILVGDRGTWVTHIVTVTNDGNDPYGDTFSFSTSGNGWVTNVSPSSVYLLPNKSTTVDVAVFIPAGTLPGSLDNVVVKATSISTVFAEISLTTVAHSSAPVLTPDTDAQMGYMGTSVSYTLHLVNTNIYTDTFILSASGNSWTTNIDKVVVVLGAGQSADIVVTVTIPSDAPSGMVDVVTIKAKSLLDPTKTDQSVLTTTSMRYPIFLPWITK